MNPRCLRSSRRAVIAEGAFDEALPVAQGATEVEISSAGASDEVRVNFVKRY